MSPSARKSTPLAQISFLLLTVLFIACSSRGSLTPASQPQASVTPEIAAQPTSEKTPQSSPLPPTGQPDAPQVPRLEAALRTAGALQAAEHPARDYYRLALQLLGVSPDSLTPQAPGDPNLQVNDRTNFFVNADLNGDYRPFPARLRYLSENAAWWTSVSARAQDDEIMAAAEFFETEVLPINRLIFGKERSPGLDNDRRIHILLVEEPLWGGFFGYFSVLNQYPTVLQPFSNQREMFVINLGGVRIDSVAFGGELAHEYQHLIHWNLDPNEDLWLNEAMGELAVFLTGAAPSSSAVGKTNAEQFAEMSFIQLTARPERRFGEEDKAVFAHYAAERLFAVYLLEQFGPRFIKDVVNNPDPGVFSIQQELDKLPDQPRFTEVYANWLLANLLNQPNLSENQFGYQEISPMLPEREIINSFRGQPVQEKLAPFGSKYYEIQSDKDVRVQFTAPGEARLTPVDPASGQFAWYSNRGDESVFSLSRSFDLTGLETATLNYKVWYELEEFFDFAYLEISTDGGETWTILETGHGTDRDPRGLSYGWAYTGAVLEWVQESIDLSPYTGQIVQIRFEVVTDFTTNRDGLQVDDIEIPELGYFDGAENESGGWEAHGFIRSSNFVPVKWIVWLVELTQPTRLTRIDLDTDQSADFQISGFGVDFPLAALVVSPTAPVTTMELEYELIFENP